MRWLAAVACVGVAVIVLALAVPTHGSGRSIRLAAAAVAASPVRATRPRVTPVAHATCPVVARAGRAGACEAAPCAEFITAVIPAGRPPRGQLVLGSRCPSPPARSLPRVIGPRTAPIVPR